MDALASIMRAQNLLEKRRVYVWLHVSFRSLNLSKVFNEISQHEMTCRDGNLIFSWLTALINIGKRLGKAQQSKEEKTSRLVAELRTLNLNLPARVWLPIHADAPHLVVRIPPESAVVLNSKDKAPYLLYVEVLLVEQTQTCSIPAKISATAAASLRHTRSEENLLDHHPLHHNLADSSGLSSLIPSIKGALFPSNNTSMSIELNFF